jgi:HD-GYP domain-containing protein (c-di-GMP phosphodiesterase class II)
MVEIIAVSDIYDALVSDRPYRKEAYENRRALEEITEMAATGKIGWEGVRALISHNRETKPAPEACIVSGEKRNPPTPENVEGRREKKSE